MSDQFDPTAEGWEAPAQSNSGVYLRLAKKGDKIRIRICSKPLKFEETFFDKQKQKDITRTNYGFVVIHKELIDGKPVKTVKAFKAGTMIYRSIYGFATNPDWGNPATYDIEITRTEEDSNYYVIQPLPRPIGPLSQEEQALVAAANLDLHQLFIEQADHQETYNGPVPPDNDPFADE